MDYKELKPIQVEKTRLQSIVTLVCKDNAS
jgi:hypothetical protein